MRFQKAELLSIKADFKNEQLSRLQFFTYCLEQDKEIAITHLIAALEERIKFLTLENENALKAFKNGYTII